ncbi:MAG: hypothetical protein ABIH00_03195 [Armatimonadota bacterium]
MNKLKTITLLLLILFILALFFFSGLFKQPDYFPLTQDSEWIYKFGDKDLIVVVNGEENIDNIQCAVMETIMDKEIMQKDYYDKNNKEVLAVMKTYNNNNIKVKLTPPQTIMKLPLKTGKSWVWTGKFKDTGDITFNFKVAAFEKVTVPAGTFKAFKIDITADAGMDRKITVQRWYAAGIGLIKETSGLPPLSLTHELKGYKIEK